MSAMMEIDSMKTEKAKAMLKFNMLQVIWKIFRLIELGLVIILLYWASARLPIAIRISGEYFRRLITVVVSPIFVFLISNVIVFALVFKTGQNSAVNNAETDLYDEIVMNGDNGFDLEPENYQVKREAEEIVYQDKQVIVEEAKVEEKVQVPDKTPTSTVAESKHYRRSDQSEKLKGERAVTHTPTPSEKFRRSETMICSQKQIDSARLTLVDELSNEEFQRKIESFIAKQVKFHLQEKSAIVTASS